MSHSKQQYRPGIVLLLKSIEKIRTLQRICHFEDISSTGWILKSSKWHLLVQTVKWKHRRQNYISVSVYLAEMWRLLSDYRLWIWWHDTETLSALLPLCAGNPLVAVGALHNETHSYHISAVATLNEQLNKKWVAFNLRHFHYLFNFF